MKKAPLYFFINISALFSFHVNAQIWATLGNPDFSAGGVNYTSIAIDSNNITYVVYEDYGNNAKTTVMKYSGGNWVTVGIVGFSADTATYTTIRIDGGTPYVAYVDKGNGNKATVMKYNGSGWVTVGSAGFSAGTTTYTSMALDNNGTPYIVYVDGSDSNKATVMKYNGSSWVTVGSAGFSAGAVSYTAIAIDSSGTPYVVYQDLSDDTGLSFDGATVMKYNGSRWVTIGSVGFSGGPSYYTSIAIDTGGTPYVVYSDNWVGNDGIAMKHNDSGWVMVGSTEFGMASSNYTSIAIDENGIPYVIYQDYSNSDSWIGQAIVKKYNGSSWAFVGNADFSPGGAYFTNIAIDRHGSPYVVYMDAANDNKVMVMTIDSNLSLITGINNFCIWTTTVLSDSTPGGVWSSSNTTIATVSSSGVVTGVGKGYATIFYTVSNNSTAYEVSIDSLYSRPIYYPNIDSICRGQTDWVYIDTGGTWFSTDTSIATIVTDTSDGSAYLTGVTSGTVSVGLILTSACGIDTVYYSFLIGNCTEQVKNIAILEPSIIIFPNPVPNSLTISSSDKIISITITNLLGQTIYTNTYNSEQVQIDVANLPTGMYLVKINNTEVRKFVKQ